MLQYILLEPLFVKKKKANIDTPLLGSVRFKTNVFLNKSLKLTKAAFI